MIEQPNTQMPYTILPNGDIATPKGIVKKDK